MAGSLIKIDEEIVTSAVASVDLGGTNWDSSYDVYLVQVNNVQSVTDQTTLQMRVLKSSSADATANYDRAEKVFKAYGAFGDNYVTNDTKIDIESTGNASTDTVNSNLYLFNFNNSSEYSFVTYLHSTYTWFDELRAHSGGAVHTVASASNGVQFFINSGNIASGTFTLYGLKK
jgi:hypothetical protein